MGLKDSWAASRERSRQERDAEQARWRRAEKREQLQRMGVPASDLGGLSEEDIDAKIAAEEQRQSELFAAFVGAGSTTKFSALGVQVLAGDDKVYTIGTHDSYARSNNSRVLGPLAGAEATVTDSTSAFSPGKALLMPLATAALARKEIADAMVTFPDGTVHTRSLDGSQAVRDARKQAVQFNALAGTPAAPAPDVADGPAARLRQLQELHEAGLLTQAEYEAKRADVVDSI